MNDQANPRYEMPGDNRIALSTNLAEEIRKRFEKDRENRFKLYVLAAGIRAKYLDTITGNYTADFQSWYKSNKMKELFGSLQNFTKYAMAGEVVHFVDTQTSNPEKYLQQLPLSVGALYELSMILKQSEDTFNVCLHFTPSRKSLDAPKNDWTTKRPPLINNNVTEQKIRLWRQRWNNPPPPKAKRSDKRTLPFITITCSGELFDFDKKTGEKVGCIDLDDVEKFLEIVSNLFGGQNASQFKLESNMEYLIKGYYKRKIANDPAQRLIEGNPTKRKYR